MTSDTPEQGSAATPVISAGVILSNERVKRGISIQDVVDQTKLSKRQIEAIEADDYDKLPGPTFARGFVRNYARFLDLDPAPLIAWLDQHVPMAPQTAMEAAQLTAAPQPVATEHKEAGGSKKGLLALGGVVALGVAGYLIYGTVLTGGAPSPAHDVAAPQLESGVAEQPAPAEAVTETPPADAAPQDQATTTGAAPVVQPTPAVSTPAATPATSAAPAVTASPAATPSVDTAAATGGAPVRIVAKQNAWVSVIDADGKKLVFEQIAAGGEKTVSGKPPYKITIGNAESAELYYDGKAVDLASKTKGSTAKLQLD